MANEAQIDYWNTAGGAAWVERQRIFDAMLAPFGAAAIRAANPSPGQHLIDVGCGCGSTTLSLGEGVGPAGGVLGVDVSAPQLAVARERVAAAGLSDVVTFVEADAQTFAFPGGADCVYSRMGVMFFDDPTAAFANLALAVRPDGRLAFTCWQPLSANEWLAVPLGALQRVVPLPPAPPPGAPGPFALGDSDRVGAMLAAAGWDDIAFEAVHERLVLGGDDGIAGAVTHIADTSLTRLALHDVDETTRTRGLAAMRAALADHVDTNGQVRLGGTAWLVRARRSS